MILAEIGISQVGSIPSTNLDYYNLMSFFQPYFPFILLAIGVLFFVGIQMINSVVFPKPPDAVRRSINISYTDRRYKKKEKKYDKEIIENDKIKFKKQYVLNAYKRLGIIGTYVTYENNVKKSSVTIRMFSILGGIVLFLILLTTMGPMVGVVALLICGYVFLQAEQIADYLELSGLESKIRRLNKYQLIEIDILMTRFMAIIEDAGTNSLTSVVSRYSENIADSTKSDLNTLLVDLNISTIPEALDTWRERISMDKNHGMQDVIRFIEKLKKLYVQGDTYGLYTEMFQIRTMIVENYFKPFIQDLKKDRTKKIMSLFFGMVIILFIVIALPLVYEVIPSLMDVQNESLGGF